MGAVYGMSMFYCLVMQLTEERVEDPQGLDWMVKHLGKKMVAFLPDELVARAGLETWLHDYCDAMAGAIVRSFADVDERAKAVGVDEVEAYFNDTGMRAQALGFAGDDRHTADGGGIGWRTRYYPENISGKDWDDMPWSKPRGNDGDEAAGEDGSHKPADDSDSDVSDDEKAKMKIMGKMGPSLWRNFDGLRLNKEGDAAAAAAAAAGGEDAEAAWEERQKKIPRGPRGEKLDARTMLLRQRMYEKCYGDYAQDIIGDNFQPRQYQGYKSMSIHVMRALKDFGATTCWVKPFLDPLASPWGGRFINRPLRITLVGCAIHDAGAACVASALRSPGCAIVELDLALNFIGSRGIAALGDALAHNAALARLSLEGNAMGNADLETFLEAGGRSA